MLTKLNDSNVVDLDKITAICKYGHKSDDKKGIRLIVSGQDVYINTRTLSERDELYDKLNYVLDNTSLDYCFERRKKDEENKRKLRNGVNTFMPF